MGLVSNFNRHFMFGATHLCFLCLILLQMVRCYAPGRRVVVNYLKNCKKANYKVRSTEPEKREDKYLCLSQIIDIPPDSFFWLHMTKCVLCIYLSCYLGEGNAGYRHFVF